MWPPRRPPARALYRVDDSASTAGRRSSLHAGSTPRVPLPSVDACATATAEAGNRGGVHIARADLPTGFAARGSIWQQVLAGLTLSRGEREAWHGSSRSSADAAQWLLCRVAAKDAVRRWLAERELPVPPADIVISDGLSGAMQRVKGRRWSAVRST